MYNESFSKTTNNKLKKAYLVLVTLCITLSSRVMSQNMQMPPEPHTLWSLELFVLYHFHPIELKYFQLLQKLLFENESPS